MNESNEAELKASSDAEPIKVHVVNSDDLQTYLIKMALAAGVAIVIKKGGEILIDDLNEWWKARRKAKKEAKLHVVKND